MEKCLDLKSNGTIAQCDVQQHYDTLCIIRIFHWLLNHGCSASLAAACVRHQLATPIKLQIGDTTATVTRRSSGGLAGSRVAGQLGRIPVQSTLCDLKDELLGLSWQYNDIHLCALSFVDNLFFVSKTAYQATFMATLFERHLHSHWAQKIKPDSKECMPCFGIEEDEPIDDTWTMMCSMKVLGHILNNRCSVIDDFNCTVGKIWRAFWANSGSRGGQKLPLQCKL